MTNKTIQLAKSLIESGSFLKSGEELQQLIAPETNENPWLWQVIGGVCLRAVSEFNQMSRACVKHGSISEVAWRARNLLELDIWMALFVRDENYASTFFRDAGQDAHDLFDKMQKWDAKQPDENDRLVITHETIERLKQAAAARGVHDIDGKYSFILTLAKDTEHYDHYIMMNKLLSKFAHPTAFSIIQDPTDSLPVLLDYMFELGCVMFIGIYQNLLLIVSRYKAFSNNT